MTRLLWAPLGLGLLVLGSACSVTALAERERSTAVNECAADDECGNGSCVDGACRLTSPGELDYLVFELTPSVKAGALGGKSLWLEPARLRSSQHDLVFKGVSRVTGGIAVTPIEGCAEVPFVGLSRGSPVPIARDLTIPARVTFLPTNVYGLGREFFTAAVDTSVKESLLGGGPPDTSVFRFNIPVAHYDIYIEPTAIHAQATEEQKKRCELPPVLLREQLIGDNPQNNLTIRLPPPSEITLELRFPSAGEKSFAGWALDMIDPESGRVISTRKTIPPDAKSGTGWPLKYLPVAVAGAEQADRSANELVRLSPPAGLVAPTFLFERSSLELFERGVGVLAPLETMPSPITFEGRVIQRDGGAPVQASVTLTATRLARVPAGVFGSFSRTVQSDAKGRFELPLLPGSYHVRAVPDLIDGQSSGGLAVAEATWDVPETPVNQAGRVVEVGRLLDVSGRATLRWNASGAFGATAAMEPSVLQPRPNALARLLAGDAPSPRSFRASIVATNGEFALSAERGRFDVFVRPPEASNLGWYVMPKLDVDVDSYLGNVELPLPVRIEGTVSLRSFITDEPPPLSQSLLRAYVLLDEDGSPTRDDSRVRGAVAVAEGRLDEFGHYVLNVPASLNPAEKR